MNVLSRRPGVQVQAQAKFFLLSLFPHLVQKAKSAKRTERPTKIGVSTYNVAHHEVPRVVLVVRHLEARDPRDHVVVDRQDHLPVQVDERHLQAEK